MTRLSKFARVAPTAVGLTCAAALAACATTPTPSEETLATATLLDTDGNPTGEARLLGVGHRAELAVTVEGLTPGEHGFHLHTTGRCALPDFKSAGGHLNPANKGHGLLDNDGSHLGDLPNLVVAANGTASVQVPLDGTRTYVIDQIFDADGTAVVIHADADDGRTDPSGNAGSRVRCGVLEQA
ncbi:superoxide dismutase family protein [Alteriqipengyuania sp. NZ-12B]|uniref:Superoxide dismutase family protein n=1 Tax=Alteriqipengyuania abyssalis TaxID=2860200 RepID=A0ABS7PCL5_9SPHN|nr:superoxide dismutase family protein [Alteriqipengyuania abyssalis]MBY8336795.1 superoxide dismutase family protein [Alteriqipengyuania abyssalis]